VYYRVVDELQEPQGKVLDSRTVSKNSVRKVRAEQLYTIFDCVGTFSEKEDIKLDVALNIATFPEIYIPQLKAALGSGRQEVSFGDLGCFMIDREIKIRTLIEYIQSYQAVCSGAKTRITEKDSDRECVRDYVWEKERRRMNEALPPRGASVTLFDNESGAEGYRSDYFGDFASVMQADIRQERAFGRYDMSWFTGVPGSVTYREAARYAQNYWKGKANDEPVWEFLRDGTYVLSFPGTVVTE
jgi:hypothetical protein